MKFVSKANGFLIFKGFLNKNPEQNVFIKRYIGKDKVSENKKNSPNSTVKSKSGNETEFKQHDQPPCEATTSPNVEEIVAPLSSNELVYSDPPASYDCSYSNQEILVGDLEIDLNDLSDAEECSSSQVLIEPQLQQKITPHDSDPHFQNFDNAFEEKNDSLNERYMQSSLLNGYIYFQKFSILKPLTVEENLEDLSYGNLRNIISSYFLKCHLIINSKFMKKVNSRVKVSPQLTSSGACSDVNCSIKYKLVAFTWTQSGGIFYLYYKGEMSELHGSSSQLRGYQRETFAQKVIDGKSATGLVIQNIASSDRRQVFQSGGTVTPSAAVISKAACELRLQRQLSPDPWHSVSILKDCLISTDDTSKQFPGFIQRFEVVNKFIVLHCEDQLAVSKYAKNIHIDATGGLILPMQGEGKVLLFSIVMDDSESHSNLALSNCLTQHQRATDVECFYKAFVNDYRVLHKADFRPEIICTDFSFAILNGICECLGTKLDKYINQKFAGRSKHDTQIFLCTCHLYKTIARKCSVHFKDKECRKYMMTAMARVIDAPTQKDLDIRLKLIFRMLLSKHVEYSVLEAYDQLYKDDDAGYETVLLLDNETDDAVYDSESDVDASNNIGPTYREKTSSGKHYQNLLNEVKAELQPENLNSNEKNPLCSPPFTNYLMTHILPFSPLWSQRQCLKQKKAVSNAPVENYFRTLKMCHTKQKLSPADLIQKLFDVDKSNAVIYLSKLSNTKPSKKIKTKNPLLFKENWNKSKKKKIPYKNRMISSNKVFKNLKEKIPYEKQIEPNNLINASTEIDEYLPDLVSTYLHNICVH